MRWKRVSGTDYNSDISLVQMGGVLNMNVNEYRKAAQEMRNVLLYNQRQSGMLLDDMVRMGNKFDDVEPLDYGTIDQIHFLKERDIELNLKFDSPKREKGISVQDLSWEEITDKAKESGCVNARFEDILTRNEISDAENEYHIITEDFCRKTKLTKVDAAFLSFAVLLQVIRQYILTPLNKNEVTVSASDAEIEFKEKYNNGGDYNKTYYRASRDCILNQKFVPYDAINGSKEAGFAGEGKGVAGTNHRYYTMGHDPVLYSIVGTSNILTNTITLYDGRTFHVKYRPNKAGCNVPKIVEEANTRKMFRHTWERMKESGKLQIKMVKMIKRKHIPTQKELEDLVNSFMPFAAFFKAKCHLKSDNSKNGLPVPFTMLFSPDFAKELSEYGFDAAGLGQVVEDSFKQAAGSVLINYMIAVLHGMICKAEYQEDLKFVQVRTRKILLLSNLIATSSNIVATTAVATVSAYQGNEQGIEFARKHMDIGGALITLTRVFSDLRFISSIRDEYIRNRMDREMDKVFAEIENMEAMVTNV